jgi:uncharacterized protein YjbJ (UPF0337 family)
MEPKREIDMDENRISGTARNVVGKVEKGLGRAAGDASSEFKGKLDEAAGGPKICTVRQLTQPGRPPSPSTSGYATPSKRSLTPAPLVAVGTLAGSWEGCIDRSNQTCFPT